MQNRAEEISQNVTEKQSERRYEKRVKTKGENQNVYYISNLEYQKDLLNKVREIKYVKIQWLRIFQN